MAETARARPLVWSCRVEMGRAGDPADGDSGASETAPALSRDRCSLLLLLPVGDVRPREDRSGNAVRAPGPPWRGAFAALYVIGKELTREITFLAV